MDGFAASASSGWCARRCRRERSSTRSKSIVPEDLRACSHEASRKLPAPWQSSGSSPGWSSAWAAASAARRARHRRGGAHHPRGALAALPLRLSPDDRRSASAPSCPRALAGRARRIEIDERAAGRRHHRPGGARARDRLHHRARAGSRASSAPCTTTVRPAPAALPADVDDARDLT